MMERVLIHYQMISPETRFLGESAYIFFGNWLVDLPPSDAASGASAPIILYHASEIFREKCININ
jgi:hypothetical protein